MLGELGGRGAAWWLDAWCSRRASVVLLLRCRVRQQGTAWHRMAYAVAQCTAACWLCGACAGGPNPRTVPLLFMHCCPCAMTCTVQSFGSGNISIVSPTAVLIAGPIRISVAVHNGSTGEPGEQPQERTYTIAACRCMGSCRNVQGEVQTRCTNCIPTRIALPDFARVARCSVAACSGQRHCGLSVRHSGVCGAPGHSCCRCDTQHCRRLAV